MGKERCAYRCALEDGVRPDSVVQAPVVDAPGAGIEIERMRSVSHNTHARAFI